MQRIQRITGGLVGMPKPLGYNRKPEKIYGKMLHKAQFCILLKPVFTRDSGDRLQFNIRIIELPEGYFRWSDGYLKYDGIITRYGLYNVGTETMFDMDAHE